MVRRRNQNKLYLGDWNAICNTCGAEKPITEFRKHPGSKTGYRPQCKVCKNKVAKAWRDAQGSRYKGPSAATRRAHKKWRQTHLAYDAFRARTYRARKLQAIPSWADIGAIKFIYETCPAGFHVDHIIPLKGTNICGLHVEYNLQHLPAIDNIRKKNYVQA